MTITVLTMIVAVGGAAFALHALQRSIMMPASWLLVIAIAGCVSAGAILVPGASSGDAAALAAGGGTLDQLPIVGALALCGAAVASALLMQRAIQARLRLSGIALLHPAAVAMLALACHGLLLANASLAAVPLAVVTAPFLVGGWWLAMRRLGTAQAMLVWLWLLGIIVVGSLASLMIAPAWARGGGHAAALAGSARLFGITDHPDTLSACAMILLCLACIARLPLPMRLLLIAAALAGMVMTSTPAALLALAGLGIYGVIRLNANGLLRANGSFVVLVALAGVLGVIALMTWSDALRASPGPLLPLPGRTADWSPAAGVPARDPDLLAPGGILDGLAGCALLAAVLRWIVAMPRSRQRTMAICCGIVVLGRGFVDGSSDAGALDGDLLMFLCCLTFMAAPQPAPARASMCAGWHESGPGLPALEPAPRYRRGIDSPPRRARRAATVMPAAGELPAEVPHGRPGPAAPSGAPVLA